jgi:hypothetical protein
VLFSRQVPTSSEKSTTGGGRISAWCEDAATDGTHIGHRPPRLNRSEEGRQWRIRTTGSFSFCNPIRPTKWRDNKPESNPYSVPNGVFGLLMQRSERSAQRHNKKNLGEKRNWTFFSKKNLYCCFVKFDMFFIPQKTHKKCVWCF